MYTGYWASADLWTSQRKNALLGDRPENILSQNILSKIKRPGMPNTTSDLAKNDLQAPNANGLPPANPYTPYHEKEAKIPVMTWRAPKVFIPESAINQKAFAQAPVTRFKAEIPNQCPNSGNIGHCAIISKRQQERAIQADRAFREAAREAGQDGHLLVHSEGHHFRWQYPHTLGRMKAYAQKQAEERQAVHDKHIQAKREMLRGSTSRKH